MYSGYSLWQSLWLSQLSGAGSSQSPCQRQSSDRRHPDQGALNPVPVAHGITEYRSPYRRRRSHPGG